MINQELAGIFDEIADLLEIQGEDVFRVNAYRKVARVVGDLTEDITAVAARNELTKISGIGKGTAEKIHQYLADGRIAVHQELRSKLPEGLLDLLQIPGLGPKKVAVLFHQLKVESVDHLRSAIAAGKVEKLPGFGARSVEKIVEGIEFLAGAAGRTPLGIACEIAEKLLRDVAGLPGAKRVEAAGSLRRGRETVGDLDLLCEAGDGSAVVRAFTQLPLAKKVLAAGDTKGAITVFNPDGGEIQVDLRVVPGESFGAALQYFTGSKEHNVRLREIAVKKGWKLNEYGLFDGEKMLAGKDEAGIYKKLGLPLIPPELREDRGEIDGAKKLPVLVTLEDIRGDLHVHTTASDGRSTIEQMAAAAKQRGYSYLAITDHSRSSVIANGLSIDKLRRHTEIIRAANEKLKGITLLTGIEVDILSDGSLDYPDKVLAELDWVVASVHSAQGQDCGKVTARTIAAMENPHVHAIGHPSGRLLGKRDAMDLDWEAVFEAAARTGTVLEINASWQRLDLKDVHVRQALEAGCFLAISTDAHATDQLEQIRFGVTTARRGWASAERIINTWPLAQLNKWIAA
ncbi:MAG TPA: DNA polymerase/3'-5' exonuclease PolX [Phycisphaerae bacterium]|nr:DNA polymerase/3'-5' exonuclease PolX [Phycisphaerae bacterium]